MMDAYRLMVPSAPAPAIAVMLARCLPLLSQSRSDMTFRCSGFGDEKA
jgi:hypothetical protein